MNCIGVRNNKKGKMIMKNVKIAEEIENKFDAEVEVMGNVLILDVASWYYPYGNKIDQLEQLAINVSDLIRKCVFDVDYSMTHEEIRFTLIK